jgi:hypothetical protein
VKNTPIKRETENFGNKYIEKIKQATILDTAHMLKERSNVKA